MACRSLPRLLAEAALAALLLAPLAGCGTTDRIVASSIPLEDYKVRHPIVISESRTSLDIFPAMEQGRLDSHSAKQVYAFAEQYRELGRGEIFLLVPRSASAGVSRAIVADIKHVLNLGGARAGVRVASYPAADPRLASPIRLSYNGIKANVADQCGQWPSDLASGSSVEEWDNKPYWNLGCATQTMIAAQTSDPRDLVTPRGEEPSDALIRSRGIETIRKGNDPNTSWTVKNSNIGNVGGS